MEQKEENEIISKKIKTEAENLWNSMDSFYNLWNKIYEDCKKNSTIGLFEEWKELHISIYMNWKEISNTCQQFQQSLKIILRVLNIAKAIETLDINSIEEIAKEVKKFSKATEMLMEDKYCIELLSTKYFDFVNEKLESQYSKNQPRVFKCEHLFMSLSTKISNFFASFIIGTYTKYEEARAKKIDTKFKEDGLADLARDLSKLSGFSIPMNVSFKYLGDLINEAIQNVSIGNISAEVQIKSLISITQKLQEIFDTTYCKASKYEGITRILVMKSNPRFLINQ